MKPAQIVLVVVVVVVAWYTILNATDKQARIECEQWNKDAQELRGWYSTEWQRKQCATVGVPLPMK